MTKFKLLVSAVARRSNFVGSAELLGAVERYSEANIGPRKWALFRGEAGLLYPASTPHPRFLFRGQTQRYTPCFPSLYRHYRYPAKYLHQLEEDDAATIVANIAKTFLFFSEMRHHPVPKWAKSARVALQFTEIAQHHGIPTPLIDLSTSIEVAMFFATHDYNELSGYSPRTEGRGVLYIVDHAGLPKSQRGRFRSVAIQPFTRPYMQSAWSCELLMGECFEECPCLAILEFEHTAALANSMRERAEAKGELFPPDILAVLGDAIRSMAAIPTSAVIEALKHLGPAYPQHLFGPPEKLLRNAGFSIWDKYEPVFSKEFWDRKNPTLREALNSWLSETVQNKETLLVRRSKTGEPVALARFKGPLITPGSFEIIRQIEPIYTEQGTNPAQTVEAGDSLILPARTQRASARGA
jgi:FRG domain